MRGGDAATRADAWNALDNLTGTRAASEATVRAAAPIQLAQAGAIAGPMSGPGSMSGLGWGVNPIEIWEALRLLRIGSLVGLAIFLTTPPPRPEGIRLSADLLLVANWRPGVHAFYIQGADGLWRMAPVMGHGTPEGQLVVDLGALAAAYGGPLPGSVLEMARPRPSGVPAQLQTTNTTIATAMANAPDPCKNLPGQRHHMIPASLMTRHQVFLTRVNFTLDQGANLINLPSSGPQQSDMQQQCRQNRPVHNGRTASHYENAVSDKLNQIEGELNALRITPQQAASRVDRLMSLIRSELESGRYTNVNDPNLARAISGMRL